MNSGEFARTNPRMRRRALITFGLMAALGAIAIVLGLPWLLDSLTRVKAGGSIGLRIVCTVLLVLIAAPGIALLALARRHYLLARRIISQQRLPPDDAIVLPGTQVITGPAAVRVGRLTRIIALVLALAGAVPVALAGYGLLVLY